MADMNPYEVLGVARDADAATIKKAYRQRAAANHPDVGRSREDFERIVMANIVLSDPKRRSRYDRTGKIDEQQPDNTESAIISRAVQAVLQAASSAGQHGEPTTFDLVTMAKQQLAQGVSQIIEGQRLAEMNATRVEKIASKMEMKRKRKKDPKPDFMAKGLLSHAAMIREGIARATNDITIMNKAIELLDDYNFIADVQQMQTVYFTVGIT